MHVLKAICLAAIVSGSPAIVRADPAPATHSGALRVAQNFRPPGSIPGEGPGDGGSSDVAGLLLRIDRLEDQVRSLNGEIEQLQFTQKQLQDALQKFQKDVDFRFQDMSHRPTDRAPAKRSDLQPPVAPAGSETADVGAGPARPQRDDAFEPADHPDAPGAPRSLGTLGGDRDASSDGGGAPLQLDNGIEAPAADAGAPVVAAIPTAPAPAPGVSDVLPADPREDFDLALVSFNNGRLGEAETGFQGFMERHPKDRLAPEAMYYLGEIYWRTGKVREAAQQYLKISTDFPRSAHAPESLLKLGLALEKLGSKDQACASFEQISRKYPTASASVRASVERNLKRDKC